MTKQYSGKPLSRIFAVLFCTALLMGYGTQANALMISGETFSVADGFSGPLGIGTHFHSNDAGSFGQLPDLAEVGDLGAEEIRGLSEFDLTGLSTFENVILTFSVFSQGGLFGQGPSNFIIDVLSYTGNNSEDLSDFQIGTTGIIGSFDTSGLGFGNILALDITSIFNTAIGNADNALGIRLQQQTSPNGGAYTFNNFQLHAVPEPSPLLLMGLGLLGVWARRRA